MTKQITKISIIIKMMVLLSALFSLFTFASSDVYAAKIDEQNYEGFDYTFDTDTKTATITKYRQHSADVVIPKTVNYKGVDYTVDTIGGGAFNYFSIMFEIKTVVLPDSIVKISDTAFGSQAKLTSINFPDGLEYIGIESFYDCVSLTEITIPNSVKGLGSEAFFGCTNLKSITSYISSGCKKDIASTIFGYSKVWNNESSDYEFKAIEGISYKGYHNLKIDNIIDGLTNPGTIEYIEEPLKELRVKCAIPVPEFGDTINQPVDADYSLDMEDGDPGYDLFGVNAIYSGWYYYSTLNGRPYYKLSDGDKYSDRVVTFMLEINPLYKGWYDFRNTDIYLNGKLCERIVFETYYDYYFQAFYKFDLDAAEIEIQPECYGNNYDNKVKIDGDDFTGYNVTKLVKKGSTQKLIAQAADGYEFVEWRKAKGDLNSAYAEPVGTNTTITVNPTEDVKYYAMFRPILSSSGELDGAKYEFNSVTGTLVFSPKNPGSSDYISVGDYSVGDSPFSGNDLIKNVIFEEGINGIYDGLFYGCNNIGYIKIPSTVNYIGSLAFNWCYIHGGDGFDVNSDNDYYKSVDGVLYTKNGKKLERFAQKPSVTEFAVPEGVETIGHRCFDSVRLDKLTLQNDGLTLYNYAIKYADIKHVEIKNGVENLGDYSDWLSEDTEVYIPASVKEVGSQITFTDGEKVTAINVDPNNTVYESIDGVIYKKTEDGLIIHRYPSGKTKEIYTTPAGVKSIGFCSFRGPNPYLKEIVFSEDMEEINFDYLESFSDMTFKVMNSNCNFVGSFSGSGTNIMMGYKGSTAEIYATKTYPYSFTFVPLDSVLGTLAKPSNLSWEGSKAKWDAVPNAEKYLVELRYIDNGYDYLQKSLYTTDTEVDLKDEMYGTEYKYYFRVTAMCIGYDLSETAESAEISSWVIKKDITGINVDGYVLSWDPYVDNGGHEADEYLVLCYDQDDNIVLASSGASTSQEIGSYYKGKGLGWGNYKITITAKRYVNSCY